MTSETIAEWAAWSGDDCQARVGRYVRPDGWGMGGVLLASDWDRAHYYLPVHSGGPVNEVAVNVTVTGRTIQADQGSSAVRVMIEFVGDCEPSTVVRGWLHLN